MKINWKIISLKEKNFLQELLINNEYKWYTYHNFGNNLDFNWSFIIKIKMNCIIINKTLKFISTL
jgi:hypothetical protein